MKKKIASILFVMCSFASAWTGVVLVGCGGGDDKGNAPPPDPTSREAAKADRGLVAVQNRKCNTCHGTDMSGSATPIPQQDTRLELYPPNLTNSGLGIKDWTDDQLAAAIRHGYDRDGLQLCPQMKHDSNMTDYEAFSIVLYLRSLPAKETKVPRSVCPPLKLKSEQTQ